jgi:hypothetical protein
VRRKVQVSPIIQRAKCECECDCDEISPLLSLLLSFPFGIWHGISDGVWLGAACAENVVRLYIALGVWWEGGKVYIRWVGGLIVRDPEKLGGGVEEVDAYIRMRTRECARK